MARKHPLQHRLFAHKTRTRLVLAVACVTVMASLASVPGQAATRHRLSSAACSNETINVFGKVAVRFVLHGQVSCGEARRTMRAYALAIVKGRCPTEICTEVTFPGGLTCSTAVRTLQGPNRPTWGCERSGASFDVYKVRRHRPGPGYPPCTRQALIAGLRRGADPQPTATFSRGTFGCAGRFAYASGVVVHRYDEVVLFIARSGRWETADRGKYCPNHQVPAKIYKGACTTS